MDCLVLPVSNILRKRSRVGYRQLTEDGFCGGHFDRPVTVVVGKEKREFLVDPFVLEEIPFRVLMETVRSSSSSSSVIFVDVDAILFEHMLWLMYNDCCSLFQLNLKEIIDFYSLDY